MEQNNNHSNIYVDKIFTIPNVLSLIRIALIPVIIWLYVFATKNYMYYIAGGILILSAITDIVDGFIARKFNMISNLGKILDPIADKLTQAAVLVCLIIKFYLTAIPLGLMVLKESFQAISGYIATQKTGKVYSAEWHGKLATILLYSLMLLHFFWIDINWIVSLVSIIVCSVAILLSFVLYGIKNIKLIKKAGITLENQPNEELKVDEENLDKPIE